MLRLSLEEIILRALASMKNADETYDVRALLAEALDPPPVKNVEKAFSLLQQLNALDSDGNITPLGKKLALLPVDSRLGKMLLYACSFRCLDPVLTIASSLSLGKSPFLNNFDDSTSNSSNIAKLFKTGTHIYSEFFFSRMISFPYYLL